MLSTETIAISLSAFPSKVLSDKLGDISSLAITRILPGITYASLYFIKRPPFFILIPLERYFWQWIISRK